MKFSYSLRNGVLAVCDLSIKGRVVSESPRIEAGDFYGSEEIGEEVVELLEKASSANLLGNEIVSLFIEKGLVDPSGVLEFNGVKHAIIIKI